jgi:hypothetical protein
MKTVSSFIVLVCLVLISCPGPSTGDIEPVNPNVSIQLDRGTMTLLATHDYIHFPNVKADGAGGSASPALSFTVRNTGTEALTVYRVTASGASGDFSVDTAGLSTSIAAGASSSFTVSFNPLTTGDKTVTVLVKTNAANAPSYEIVGKGRALPMPVNQANTATHNFTSKTHGDLVVTPRGVIPGRIHPDGVSRIIAGSGQNPGANQGSWITVFKRDTGAGIWDFVQETQFRFTTDQWDMFEPLLCHDFDGDGVDEIFAKLNGAPCFVKWDGSAYVRVWYSESSLITCNYGALIADVDRDGAPELLTGNETSTYIYSWGTGFTGFVLDTSLTGGNSFSVGVGDIDGDGFLEIAAANEGSTHLYVYRFDGAAYQPLWNDTAFASTTGYSGFAAADLDGDYADELVGASPNYGGLHYYTSVFNWNGSALAETTLSDNSYGKFQLAAGDFDRDGQEEVLVEENGGNEVLVEMTGGGITAVQMTLNINLFLSPFDQDGDGFPELAISKYMTAGATLIIRDEVNNP